MKIVYVVFVGKRVAVSVAVEINKISRYKQRFYAFKPGYYNGTQKPDTNLKNFFLLI